MGETKNYNELFAELQKECDRKQYGNAFSRITLEELIDLNGLLDRVMVFCENFDEDFDEFECGAEMLDLYRLVKTLFDKDFATQEDDCV